MRWEIDMKSGPRAGGAEKEILIPSYTELPLTGAVLPYFTFGNSG
jgi:hypothetical protein